MKIQFYIEKETQSGFDYKEFHLLEVIGKNIVVPVNVNLPNYKTRESKEWFANFKIDRSEIYNRKSQNIVNTRLSYIDSDGKYSHLFCKLDYWGFQGLLCENKEHFFQKTDNWKWAIGIIASFISGFILKAYIGCH